MEDYTKMKIQGFGNYKKINAKDVYGDEFIIAKSLSKTQGFWIGSLMLNKEHVKGLSQVLSNWLNTGELNLPY